MVTCEQMLYWLVALLFSAGAQACCRYKIVKRNSMYHDIDLKDFELAFRMSRLKRAILKYSNNAGIFDEEQTSANRKGEMLFWLIIVLVLILVFLCVQISNSWGIYNCRMRNMLIARGL